MISKNIKIFTILITILTIVIIISPVSAKEAPNASIARAVSARSLPQLQFNQTQEKITFSGKLGPEKIIQNTHTTEKISIPSGAIILHSNNITTVFDQNGKQLFITDDNKAEKIRTFNGDSPATFIHEVPSDSVIVTDGNALQVIYNNERILTIIDANLNEQYIPQIGYTCYGSPYHYQWVEGVEANISATSTTGVSQFLTDWKVPQSTSMMTSTYGRPVTIWHGLSYCTDGGVRSSLIQPVLQWAWPNSSSKTWSLQTWYVWQNETTISNPRAQTCLYSDATTSAISTGDAIQGNIQVNTLGYDAIGSATDTTTGASTTLNLIHEQDPEWNTSRPIYAQIVLEGYMYGNGYQNSAEYFPAPATFNTFTLADENGASLTDTVSMRSFVNPRWQDVTNFSDGQNLTVYNRWPQDITLVNNPERINKPVTNFTASSMNGIGIFLSHSKIHP